MTYKENVKAILECNFSQTNEELIDIAVQRICELTPTSVIEDIKAEIRTLYPRYGDGSGWWESRNITLNEVMKIINEHTSKKEQEE